MNLDLDIRPLSTLALYDKLDGLSRERALSNEESETLEAVQVALMHSNAYGMRKELARRGIPLRGHA